MRAALPEKSSWCTSVAKGLALTSPRGSSDTAPTSCGDARAPLPTARPSWLAPSTLAAPPSSPPRPPTQGGVTLVRKQLPFTLAWALTINKSQGQTLDKVLYEGRVPAFVHGHAYVGFGRVHSRADFGAFVDDACSMQLHGRRCFVVAVVTYDELLAPLRRMMAEA